RETPSQVLPLHRPEVTVNIGGLLGGWDYSPIFPVGRGNVHTMSVMNCDMVEVLRRLELARPAANILESSSMNTLLPCIVAAVVTGQGDPRPRLSGPEWPAYKGDAGLSGVSADDSIRPPFKLVWSYRLDGDASSDAGAGVTVAGGKVFVNVSNTRSIL